MLIKAGSSQLSKLYVYVALAALETRNAAYWPWSQLQIGHTTATGRVGRDSEAVLIMPHVACGTQGMRSQSFPFRSRCMSAHKSKFGDFPCHQEAERVQFECSLVWNRVVLRVERVRPSFEDT